MCNRAKNDPQTMPKKATAAASRVVRLGFLLVLCLAGTAAGQDINEAVTIEDLGLTGRLHAGARPAGMAGAYTPIADDLHSLIYNPAGLARLRRVEMGVGFQHTQNRYDNTFYGGNSTVDFSSTTLDFIGAAYPVPTYRGSLVLAFGAYRHWSSDIDILNRGLNTTTSTLDDYRLQQSGNIWSYNFGIAGDLSPNLSVGLNIFILDGGIKALTQFAYVPIPSSTTTGEFQGLSVADDADVDLDGFGARLGFQYHLWKIFHFGGTVTTPTPVNIAGDAVTETVAYFVNSPDSIGVEGFIIDSDYRTPIRFDGGFSVSALNLILTADVAYQDWRQATVNGVALKNSRLEATFRQVVELRLGGEFRIPFTPIRFRAGYGYLPYALEALQADRIEGTQITPAESTTEFPKLESYGVDIPNERQLFAVGAGVVLGKVLTLDLAVDYTKGERTIPTLRDQRQTVRGVLSASYRF